MMYLFNNFHRLPCEILNMIQIKYFDHYQIKSKILEPCSIQYLSEREVIKEIKSSNLFIIKLDFRLYQLSLDI